jgi:hypothetical protein
MLEFLFRLFLFGVGCVALADTFVAPVTESVVLDLHTQFTRRALGTNYTLHFGRSRTGSCSVGCGTYRALSDGDELLLTTTRIGRECVKIERHGEEILRTGAGGACWLRSCSSRLRLARCNGQAAVIRCFEC